MWDVCAIVQGMTQRTKRDEQEYLRPGQAAAMLGVHMQTLIRWSEAGTLGVMILPSGHRRYLRADVERIAAEGKAA